MQLAELDAQLCHLTFDVGQGWFEIMHQAVDQVVSETANEPKCRALVLGQFLNDGAYDLTIAVAVFGLQHTQEQPERVIHVSEGSIQLAKNPVLLADSSIEVLDGRSKTIAVRI